MPRAKPCAATDAAASAAAAPLCSAVPSSLCSSAARGSPPLPSLPALLVRPPSCAHCALCAFSALCALLGVLWAFLGLCALIELCALFALLSLPSLPALPSLLLLPLLPSLPLSLAPLRTPSSAAHKGAAPLCPSPAPLAPTSARKSMRSPPTTSGSAPSAVRGAAARFRMRSISAASDCTSAMASSSVNACPHAARMSSPLGGASRGASRISAPSPLHRSSSRLFASSSRKQRHMDAHAEVTRGALSLAVATSPSAPAGAPVPSAARAAPLGDRSAASGVAARSACGSAMRRFRPRRRGSAAVALRRA